MIYHTFDPHKDLKPFVKCHWTLQVPSVPGAGKQRIVPDGCIELAFILGDDIRRYTSARKFIIQPRSIVIGQITEPFYIQPTGRVDTFAVRFYPYGFAAFVDLEIHELANKETPIRELFGESTAGKLETDIITSANTGERIAIVENFLLNRLTEQSTIDKIVQQTVDTLLATKGTQSIKVALHDDQSKRRQLERKFLSQIGMSPKQLGKVIRLQTAIKAMLNEDDATLTKIAYDSDYYDQAHFTKDFKAFTGINPKEFLNEDELRLSAIFYK